MKQEEVELFLNKKVKIICVGGFCYHGFIIQVNDDNLILNDKFKQDVLLKFQRIENIICLGGSDGSI